MISQLKNNQIFVFGSNLAGNHAGGAARQAHEQFGAEMGTGEGLTGQCYAFPTLTKNMQKQSSKELQKSRNNLFLTAKSNMHLDFLLTKVGCGIAGFPEEMMKKLFRNPPKNVILPEEWR